MARPGSSLRTVMKMAVLMRIGVGWSPAAAERRHLGHRVLADMQQPQPDQRVPEAEHGPGRADGESDEQDDVDQGPAAGAQDQRRPPTAWPA